jgi:hypothetical protein
LKTAQLELLGLIRLSCSHRYFPPLFLKFLTV